MNRFINQRVVDAKAAHPKYSPRKSILRHQRVIVVNRRTYVTAMYVIISPCDITVYTVYLGERKTRDNVILKNSLSR